MSDFETKLGSVFEKLEGDEHARAFYFQDPERFLEEHGYDIEKQKELKAKDREAIADALQAGPLAGISVSTHWWGICLSFDERATNFITTMQGDTAALAGAIAALLNVIPGPSWVASAFGYVIAAGLYAEKWTIHLVDQGKGFHLNFYWPTIFAAIATGPTMGPAALAPDMIPLPN